MEKAIHGTLSAWGRLRAFSKFIYTVLHLQITTSSPIAIIPLGKIDFPLADMVKHCHTEFFHGSLNKEETCKLIDKCHQEEVSVTSAVSSAILCATATLLSASDDGRERRLLLAIPADTRRRCIPIIPNHDLSYQVSGIIGFSIPLRDTPTTSEGHLAVSEDVRKSSEDVHRCRASPSPGHDHGQALPKKLVSTESESTANLWRFQLGSSTLSRTVRKMEARRNVARW